MRTAVDWPGTALAFHLPNDPTDPDSAEEGTWHVLVVVDSVIDAERHLELSAHARRAWGVSKWLALEVSERTGLDIRVRMVTWDRWWSLRRVAGTVEHEYRRHGRWLKKPDRRRHRISDDHDEASCRHCVDFGHEGWPSDLERARDFAAVRIIEPGGDAIEMLNRDLGASEYLHRGFAQTTLSSIIEDILYSLRCFLHGVLVLRAVPCRPSTDPTLVELFDLLPPEVDRGNITREAMELLRWWERLQRNPSRHTVRQVGDIAVEMMGLVAREIRRRKNRGHRPLGWTLGHMVGGRHDLQMRLELPRWSDARFFSRAPDLTSARRAAEQLLPRGTIEYTPREQSAPELVVITDDLSTRYDQSRLMDTLEQAVGTVVPVRAVHPQVWANNATHRLAWEREANETGTWITPPAALPPAATYHQVCADRTAEAFGKAASAMRAVALRMEPNPKETTAAAQHRSRKYWDALVERLRMCEAKGAEVLNAAESTLAEMNETPNYHPRLDPNSHLAVPAAGYSEPPLVTAARESATRAVSVCESLCEEITRYANHTNTPMEKFERSLYTTREETHKAAERLGGLLWVYPDGIPPRNWGPFYLFKAHQPEPWGGRFPEDITFTSAGLDGEQREWTFEEYDQAGGDLEYLVAKAYTPEDPHGMVGLRAERYMWLKRPGRRRQLPAV